MRDRQGPVRLCYFPRWPENGDEWVHPRDRELARTLIPSPRIFQFVERVGEWTLLSYGQSQLRVRPALRVYVRHEGFGWGDQVEVLSQMGRNRPMIGNIVEMRWNTRDRAIDYRLFARQMTLSRVYRASELSRISELLESAEKRHLRALPPSPAKLASD